MMTCPQCGAGYADDMVFCIEDGAALRPATVDQPTLVITSASPINTGVSATQPRNGVSPVFAYITVALLALIVGGGLVWFLLDGRKDEEDKASNLQTPTNNSTPEATRTSNPGVRQMPTQGMDEQAVNTLLDTWQNAQNSRNFAVYRDCYDQSFEGIKRTASGKATSYNYERWLADRHKMMSGAFMAVGVEDRRVTIDGDQAEVLFYQTFRVPNYADMGPKVMRLKMTAAGPKIVYEELKSSTRAK